VAIRRINLLGGPGAGKSTLSAWLFAEMKIKGFDVEHISEYAKAWVFIGTSPTSFDQIYITSKQLHREDIVLRHEQSIIITESPLFLGACYAAKNHVPGANYLVAIAMEFERAFPSLNVFVERGKKPYKPFGRFQTHEQALEMDLLIKRMMDEQGLKYQTISFEDRDGLMGYVLSNINQS